MLRAKKHKLYGGREVHFWTRIWLGQDYGLRSGIEVCDDGNTASKDWFKTTGLDGET